MPRSRRRRLTRRASRQSLGTKGLVAVIIAVVVVLVVGSIAEIHAQSRSYRQATGQGYGALAARIVDASNQTGTQLATLIEQAPVLPVGSLPETARGKVQQGLDQAVAAATSEARQAKQLVPPSPSGNIATRFTEVIESRATAVVDLRSTIDRLLGMTPIPIAGAPPTTSTTSAASSALISVEQASGEMDSEGSRLQQADRHYAALAAQLRRGQGTDAGSIRLPASAWVPTRNPILGAAALGSTAAALEGSTGLTAYHKLMITAAGLAPPAVPGPPSGGSGLIGVSCSSPASVAPGPSSTPAVLPPTALVTTQVTVTNCGTVAESAIAVTETLALADPAGTPPPQSGAGGSSVKTSVPALRSGSSTGLTLRPLGVVGGHRYTLTISISTPAGQNDPVGTTQEFLLQISS